MHLSQGSQQIISIIFLIYVHHRDAIAHAYNYNNWAIWVLIFQRFAVLYPNVGFDTRCWFLSLCTKVSLSLWLVNIECDTKCKIMIPSNQLLYILHKYGLFSVQSYILRFIVGFLCALIFKTQLIRALCALGSNSWIENLLKILIKNWIFSYKKYWI